MRLRSIYIDDWRNLKKFRCLFDDSHETAIILGQNGSGKSNLIEAIVHIFSSLDSECKKVKGVNRRPDFFYELEYTCRGYVVDVVADPEAEIHTVVTIREEDGEARELTSEEFFLARREYLPNNVVAYYSGYSERLKDQFVEHNINYYNAVESGDPKLFRRFFFCEALHSQFILLSFLHERNKESSTRLRELVGVDSIDSAFFAVKEPGWRRAKPTQRQLEEGDERFWYARGLAQEFLDQLAKVSLAPIFTEDEAPKDFPWESGDEERWYFYVPNENQLKDLGLPYYDAAEFFSRFDIALMSDLIREVHVNVSRIKPSLVKSDITLPQYNVDFDYLSEGERQLLTVLGLLALLNDSESLFLLDEPDTHLNPLWKVEYLDLVKKFADQGNIDQILIATHDPLLISNAHREQIRMLVVEDDKIEPITPTVDPIGLGVSGILTSEMFGLSSELDSTTEQELRDQAELHAKKRKSKADKERLLYLDNKLASKGFNHRFRDPLYSLFVQEMARRQEFMRPQMSVDEIAAQEEFAAKVIDELLAAESEDEAIRKPHNLSRRKANAK